MLNFLLYAAVGLIAGLIAWGLFPEAPHMNLFVTSLIGIGGAVLGAVLARFFFRPDEGGGIYPAGFRLSVLGAVLVLFTVLHFNV